MPKDVVVGNWAQCEVVLKDQFGNPATYQPLRSSPFAVNAVATGPVTVEGEVSNTGDGTRKIAFPFTKLGTYNVVIEGMDGLQVQTRRGRSKC